MPTDTEGVGMDKIEDDFKKMHTQLERLEKRYNPQNENLHFAALKLTDSKLYSALLSLAHRGLQTVRKHRNYFSKHWLYDDGMYWYNIFLMTSSAALRVRKDKTQENIPEDVVKELIEILVDISEFSTVHYGDIVQRNYEALGNTLLAFYSKELIKLVRKKSRAIPSKRVTEFIERTIKKVKEINAIERG